MMCWFLFHKWVDIDIQKFRTYLDQEDSSAQDNWDEVKQRCERCTRERTIVRNFHRSGEDPMDYFPMY